MNSARLDHWCRRGLLAGVGLSLIAAFFSGSRPSSGGMWLLAGPAAWIGLCWLVRGLVPRATPLPWPRPARWLLAALAFTLLRYAWVIHRGDAEYAARQTTGLLLMAGLVAFTIWIQLNDLKSLRQVGVLLIGISGLVAALGGCEFLTGGEPLWAPPRPDHLQGRIAGPLRSPDEFAGVLVMVLPLALAWSVTGASGTIPRVFLGYTAGLMGIGLALSLSPGSWLAAVMVIGALTAYLWRDHRHRFGAGLILTLVLLGGGAFLIGNRAAQDTISERLPGHGHHEVRFVKWPAIARMIASRPWFGWGPGQFPSRFAAHRPASRLLQRDPADPQNTVLAALVDLGVVGTGLGFAGLVGLGCQLWRRRRVFAVPADDLHRRGNDRTGLALGAALGLMGGAIHGMFHNFLQSPPLLLGAATLSGILLAYRRVPSGRAGPIRAPVSRWLPAISGGVAAVAFAGWMARGGSEAWWLNQARVAGPATASGQIALHRAHAIEPRNPATSLALGEAATRSALVDDDPSGTRRRTAIEWYRRSLAADRHAALPHARIGEALHRLGRARAAGPWFLQALNLDPNHHLTRAEIGWHYFDRNELATAHQWFVRSLRLQPGDNEFASGYLQLIRDRTSAEPAGAPP